LTDLCWCCMVQAGDWCHTHIKFRICNEALSGACIFHCCAVIFVGWLDPPRVCFALAAGNHAFPAGRPDLGLLGETVNYVAFSQFTNAQSLRRLAQSILQVCWRLLHIMSFAAGSHRGRNCTTRPWSAIPASIKAEILLGIGV
jgi:hypothetical protein